MHNSKNEKWQKTVQRKAKKDRAHFSSPPQCLLFTVVDWLNQLADSEKAMQKEVEEQWKSNSK